MGDQRVNTEQEVITEVNTELDGLSESEHRTKSDQGVKKKPRGMSNGIVKVSLFKRRSHDLTARSENTIACY